MDLFIIIIIIIYGYNNEWASNPTSQTLTCDVDMLLHWLITLDHEVLLAHDIRVIVIRCSPFPI